MKPVLLFLHLCRNNFPLTKPFNCQASPSLWVPPFWPRLGTSTTRKHSIPPSLSFLGPSYFFLRLLSFNFRFPSHSPSPWSLNVRGEMWGCLLSHLLSFCLSHFLLCIPSVFNFYPFLFRLSFPIAYLCAVISCMMFVHISHALFPIYHNYPTCKLLDLLFSLLGLITLILPTSSLTSLRNKKRRKIF